MSQLFPGIVVRTNCSYTKEESTSVKTAVKLEDFGVKYIAEGQAVIKIETIPMSQWELKWDLESITKALAYVNGNIARKKAFLLSLEEAKVCSWYEKEHAEATKKLEEEIRMRDQYNNTLEFCNLYIIKG